MSRALTIEIFQTADKVAPFQIWFNHLDKTAQRIILRRLEYLETGHFGDCKNLSHGIYELRFQTGPGYRIYYGLNQSTVVLLLCGGDKSTQRKDIRKAKAYWNTYLELNTNT